MQQSCLYLVLISIRFPMITHIQECSLHTCLHNPIWKCSCNSARYFIWLSSLNMFCSMLAYYIPNYSVLVCLFHTFFSSFVLLTILLRLRSRVMNWLEGHYDINNKRKETACRIMCCCGFGFGSRFANLENGFHNLFLVNSRYSHAHELRTNQAEIDAIISCRTS